MIEEYELLKKHELKVLAGMIAYQDKLYSWSEKITEDHFIDLNNKDIFKQILKHKGLSEHNIFLGIENDSIKNNYSINNLLDMVEMERSNCNDDFSVEELIRYKQYRDLKNVFNNINPYDPRKEEIEKLYECLDNYNDITESIGTYKTAFLGIYQKVLNDGKEKKRKQETGFDIYDKLLGGGLSKGYHVVGARPGGCKTTFTLEAAMQYAQSNKDEIVCFVSLEVGEEDLWYKLVSNRAEISLNSLENRMCEKDMSKKYADKCQEYMNKNLQNFFYIATPNTNTIRIEKLVKDLEKKENKPCGLICIDYLQILSPIKKNTKSKTEEVQQASDDVRRLASKYKVIVLAQVNRTGDSEECPETKHIKDSSQIEQDASTIVFLWWEDKSLCKINFGIKKNRYGASDIFLKGTLEGSIGKFTLNGEIVEKNKKEDEYEGLY